ncbi:hypothetical protein GCM10007857_65420 [Bradyrhizobium iriomotense]|uniref:Uncharacterized protein n=1 Tax=Bradyrhizobium iriomotense TaxID=441950 RepID=A0ABQ6BCC9_9BRAD|nr:hypothetical protein GCM10007857_65420 [Bradyrhizobium iriomotense]
MLAQIAKKCAFVGADFYGADGQSGAHGGVGASAETARKNLDPWDDVTSGSTVRRTAFICSTSAIGPELHESGTYDRLLKTEGASLRGGDQGETPATIKVRLRRWGRTEGRA